MKDGIVSGIEQRVTTTEFEVREETDGMHFSGYAAMFNSPSLPLPFTERIAPGAFKRSLKSRNDVKFLWNHDSGEILGSTRAKTLILTEDSTGLRVDGVLPQTSRGKDVAELLRRNDVDAMSFGFSVPTGGDVWSSDGSERTLNSVRLFEVSLVGSPAYTATAGTVSVRKFEKAAERAAVSVEALADALGKIEDGLNITGEEQELLNQVITTLAPEAEVIPEPVIVGDLGLLELKKKKLELLMKGI
jgi:HK97 family phage prohead protease